MSFYFNKQSLGTGNRASRAVNAQFDELNEMRAPAQKSMNALHVAANTGIKPADAYRDFENTSVLEPKETGQHALLSLLMQVSRSVVLGKQVYEYRQTSRSGNAQLSTSGRKNVVIDHAAFGYEGTCILVHDDAFGREWLEQKANASEMFDALVDDAQNSERVVLESIDNYLWDGSEKGVKGRKWLGLRGDPSVVQAVLSVDLTDTSISGKVKFDEIRRVRDILRIDNSCTNGLVLTISPEIMSAWEEDYAADNSSNRTVFERINGITGINRIIEDSALSGNQIAMTFVSQQGLHPVTAMPISTYAVERTSPFDDYAFVKWSMIGFVAKQSKSGKKCALYAE